MSGIDASAGASLLYVILLMLAAAVAGHQLQPVLEARLGGRGEAYWRWAGLQLDLLDLRLGAPWLVGSQVALGLVGALATLSTGQPAMAAVVVGALAAATPAWLAHRAVKRRRAQLEAQLPEALRSIAASIRAGLVLPQALEIAAESSAPPLSRELMRAMKQYRLGVGLDEALRELGERVGGAQVHVALSAFGIARRAGGRMAVTLEEISASMQENAEMEEKIESASAESRMQAWVLLALAPTFFLGLRLIAPEMADLLLRDPTGQLILMASAALQVTGYVILKVLLDVEP